MREKATVVDVTARDGLQNEPKPVSTRDKLTLIEMLVRAGVNHIQTTSFVHPKWVPQMADAEGVAAGLAKFSGVTFSALVPNIKGYERAVAAGIRQMEFVIAASESFNRKNLNRSMSESLDLLRQATRLAERDGVVLRVGFSTCFHCPFEGRIPSQAVLNAARAARDIAPWRIAICDTDGMAFPDQVKETVGRLLGELKMKADEIVLHFHDTYGRGLGEYARGPGNGRPRVRRLHRGPRWLPLLPRRKRQPRNRGSRRFPGRHGL